MRLLALFLAFAKCIAYRVSYVPPTATQNMVKRFNRLLPQLQLHRFRPKIGIFPFLFACVSRVWAWVPKAFSLRFKDLQALLAARTPSARLSPATCEPATGEALTEVPTDAAGPEFGEVSLQHAAQSLTIGPFWPCFAFET